MENEALGYYRKYKELLTVNPVGSFLYRKQ